MGFLSGKRLLITGVVSNRSIAYGVACACRREGAELAFSYLQDRFHDRIAQFAADLGSDILIKMDVNQDADLAAACATLSERWGHLDGFLHSIAFAPREAIAGDFLDGLSREGFATALETSAYSFPALAKALLPLMQGRSASCLALTYMGSERVVPNYNTMGPAKAALESATRYLAASLGPKGIRANAISAGPIKTLSAAGIKGFSSMLHHMEEAAPLRRTVTTEEVGNLAAFLFSDLASGITGNTAYCDAGYHAIGMSMPPAE